MRVRVPLVVSVCLATFLVSALAAAQFRSQPLPPSNRVARNEALRTSVNDLEAENRHLRDQVGSLQAAIRQLEDQSASAPAPPSGSPTWLPARKSRLGWCRSTGRG